MQHMVFTMHLRWLAANTTSFHSGHVSIYSNCLLTMNGYSVRNLYRIYYWNKFLKKCILFVFITQVQSLTVWPHGLVTDEPSSCWPHLNSTNPVRNVRTTRRSLVSKIRTPFRAHNSTNFPQRSGHKAFHTSFKERLFNRKCRPHKQKNYKKNSAHFAINTCNDIFMLLCSCVVE
jgi:hypothetical protein